MVACLEIFLLTFARIDQSDDVLDARRFFSLARTDQLMSAFLPPFINNSAWPVESDSSKRKKSWDSYGSDGGVDGDRGGERVTPNPNLNCCQLTAHCRVKP